MYKRVIKYFQWAIDKELLQFEYDPRSHWLTINYHENLGWTHEDGIRWSLLCAQDIRDYKRPIELCNRITLMLAEHVRSAQQNVNGMLNDSRKA